MANRISPASGATPLGSSTHASHPSHPGWTRQTSDGSANPPRRVSTSQLPSPRGSATRLAGSEAGSRAFSGANPLPTLDSERYVTMPIGCRGGRGVNDMSHPSSRAAVTARPIVLAAALLWAVPGRPRAGRHPAGALGVGERANEDLGRDGDPAVEGLRLGARDLAGDADGLRSSGRPATAPGRSRWNVLCRRGARTVTRRYGMRHSDASRDVFGAGAGCGRASRFLRFCVLLP